MSEHNRTNVKPKIVEYELFRRQKKFDRFSVGYTACAKCGKLVDDGGFFKSTNDWGCFDCLEQQNKWSDNY